MIRNTPTRFIISVAAVANSVVSPYHFTETSPDSPQFLQEVSDSVNLDAIATNVLQQSQDSSEDNHATSEHNIDEFKSTIEDMVKRNASRDEWLALQDSMKEQWVSSHGKGQRVRAQSLAAHPIPNFNTGTRQDWQSYQDSWKDHWMDNARQWYNFGGVPSYAQVQAGENAKSLMAAAASGAGEKSYAQGVSRQQQSTQQTPGQGQQPAQPFDWNKYQKEEGDKWTNYGMSWAKQFMPAGFFMSSLADSFAQEDVLKEFWGDNESTNTPQKIKVQFDSLNNLITVQDEDVDVNGKPIHEWRMDKNTGRITQTTRTRDGRQTNVQTKSLGGKNVKDLTKEANDTKMALQKQRTITYIVMAVLIVLFIATSCLVCVFIKLRKDQELQEEQEAQNARNARLQNNKLTSKHSTANGSTRSGLSDRRDNYNYGPNGYGPNHLGYLKSEFRGRTTQSNNDNKV